MAVGFVLFDLDGVLVDACEWHYEALNRALHEVCGYQINRNDHLTTYNGLPTKKKLEILVNKNIIDSSHIEDIWNLKQKYTVDVIHETASIDLEKIDLLKFLKSKSGLFIKIACVTNSIRETAILMLEKTGLLEHLSFVVGSDDVKNPKPNSEPYINAMRLFGAHPQDTVIVEDSDKGYFAAINTGANVLRVKNSSELTKQKLLKYIGNVNKKKLTLSRYVREIETGLGGIHTTKVLESYGIKNEKKMMYSNLIRRIREVTDELNPMKIVEVGTGRAQLLTLFMLATDSKCKIFTYDIENVMSYIITKSDKYPDYGWHGETIGPGHPLYREWGVYYVVDASQSDITTHFSKRSTLNAYAREIRDEAMKDTAKIDLLVLDGSLVRESLKEDIRVWFPCLASHAVVIFSGATHVHDSVKVLVDDICQSFKTYRVCYNFEYDNQKDYPHNIDSLTRRPSIQDESLLEGVPSYAKHREILQDNFFSTNDNFSEVDYDLYYEFIMRHPGLIFLRKTPTINWKNIVEKLDEIE